MSFCGPLRIRFESRRKTEPVSEGGNENEEARCCDHHCSRVLDPGSVFGPGQPKEDFPSQSVEFVIHAGPGSGGILARQLTKVITDNMLMKVPLQPVNKAGASGANARAYMAKKTGNDA